MRYCKVIILFLLSILFIPTAATLAASIVNATYYGNLQITNNGSAATNQSATFTLNTTALINAGFVNASLNNTAILNDAGADTPFMPGFNGSNPWAVWVSSITSGVGGGNATLPYTLYTGGNQSMASQLRYFPGPAGMNITDNASLELASLNYTITVLGHFNFNSGANKILVSKGASTYEILLGQNEQGLVNGGILVTSSAVNRVGASNVSNGYHNITVNTTYTTVPARIDVSIVVDGATLNTSTAGTVPSDANNWAVCAANSTNYMTSFSMSISGTTRASHTWQYASVFTDTSGNGNSAVPTFRTSGSSSNVTANLTSYTPYTQSTSTPTSPNASASNITIAFTQPSNLYSELNITMPGAAWWNGVLDGANIPRAIFWFPWLFGWTCLIGLATHWLTKSLLVQGFVMAFLLILFTLMGGFGYWVAIEFIILALAFIIGEKQYGF